MIQKKNKFEENSKDTKWSGLPHPNVAQQQTVGRKKFKFKKKNKIERVVCVQLMANSCSSLPFQVYNSNLFSPSSRCSIIHTSSAIKACELTLYIPLSVCPLCATLSTHATATYHCNRLSQKKDKWTNKKKPTQPHLDDPPLWYCIDDGAISLVCLCMSECVVDIIYWIWSSFLPFPYINNNWKKQNKQLESTENVAVTTEQIKTGEKKSQTEIQRNTKKVKKKVKVLLWFWLQSTWLLLLFSLKSSVS